MVVLQWLDRIHKQGRTLFPLAEMFALALDVFPGGDCVISKLIKTACQSLLPKRITRDKAIYRPKGGMILAGPFPGGAAGGGPAEPVDNHTPTACSDCLCPRYSP